MFRFATPWLLLLAPLAVLAAWTMVRHGRRRNARLPLPRAAQWLRAAPSFWTRVERGLPWLRAGMLLLALVALARPQAGARVESVSTFGVDIIVALDVSSSMKAEDFRPKNRLAVARRTVERFIAGRPEDRLGLVVFAALASTRCPLTQDHAMLRQLLDDVDFAPPEQDGTALGLGLASAVHRLRDSDAKSRVVVLLTDGRNNRGQVGPQAAAEAARALSIKVYTVGVGSEGEVPVPVDRGPLGRGHQMVRLDLDEPLLREIAQTTGGRYFRATDPQGLAAVFETIDALEKTEVESRVRVLYTELFPYLLLPAFGVLALERLLLGTRLRRIP